ncbi:MAG: addiction module protein [Chitinophagales bacterium]
MNSIALDKKIANYVEQLNTKQKKAVLSVVKAFAEEGTVDIWEDEAFVKEIDRRTKELESGKVKGYSWDEVKKITRQSLSEMKRK